MQLQLRKTVYTSGDNSTKGYIVGKEEEKDEHENVSKDVYEVQREREIEQSLKML